MNRIVDLAENSADLLGRTIFMQALAQKAVMPPLALITVAAMCPKDWQFRLVDLNIEELRQEDIEWTEMAMLSGMAVQHSSMKEAINRLKKRACRRSWVVRTLLPVRRGR